MNPLAGTSKCRDEQFLMVLQTLLVSTWRKPAEKEPPGQAEGLRWRGVCYNVSCAAPQGFVRRTLREK